MIEIQSNYAIKQTYPLIVELVGPAGAGKTTLSRALSQRNGKIRVAADLELRKMEHLPIFVRQATLLSPVFLRRCRHSSWFTWDEIKAMVYLRGWPRVLRQQAMDGGTAILLDHGPVFKLATLNAFGSERLTNAGFEPWWNTMFRQWASTLDLVIWLDTADSDLIERINTRTQKHAVKAKAEQEAAEFLARYRRSYEQILTKLTAFGGPTLIKFDTGQVSIEEIIEEVLTTFNHKINQN